MPTLTIISFASLVAAFAEPDSHKYLLSVFDELKKNVEQPKPGVPIKKLSAEEVVKLREMLETVNSSLS